MNGRLLIALALACFWIYLAYGAYQEGRTTQAFVFLAIGTALTIWRLSRARA